MNGQRSADAWLNLRHSHLIELLLPFLSITETFSSDAAKLLIRVLKENRLRAADVIRGMSQWGKNPTNSCLPRIST